MHNRKIMKTVIKNISEIIQTEINPKKWVAGKDMSNISTIKDAFIEIDNDIITHFDSMDKWKGIEDWNNTKIIDADGGMVFSTYCDSHSHLVFASSREKEFVDRINGLSYTEIAKKGGGILNSAKKLQITSEEELYESALCRLNEVIKMGTGAIEIKSGYGLTLESELKILNIIKRLKNHTDATIKATFLGAHAIPTEYKDDRKRYMDLVINEMLPIVVEENLADYVDIFCEKGFFSPKDTKRLLEAANKHGIPSKTHVNQFNSIGGVKTSVDLGALSVDHLEIMTNEDYNSLQNSNCMPTILPACSFFLGIPYGPALSLIEKGLPVALASDYNPGSTPSGNMNFIASLGCIQLKMTPEQVINATTINTAYAMGIEKQLGSICVGKQANLFITKKMSSYAYLPYSFGHNVIKKVILKGKVQ